MRPNYTVLPDDERWMTHTNKRMAYETECDGCGQPLDAGYVTVITDRSGSEHAAAHLDNDECIRDAVRELEREHDDRVETEIAAKEYAIDNGEYGRR